MSFYEEIAANKRMTYFLFIVFFFFILALGFVFDYLFIGGAFFFVPIFVLIAIAYILYSYYNSDKIVLKISKAKPADPQKHRVFHNVAEEMAIAGGIPKPRLYVIEDTALNAFATGRDPEHSVICCTTGLLQKMNREELQGVIAHEMSHIKNQDIKVMTIAAVLVGIAVLLSDVMLRMFWFGGMARSRGGREAGQLTLIILVVAILLAVLTPIIAQLIKFAISRKREYLADASGSMLSRYPQGLASALEKIKADKEPLEAANKATAHLYIANPLKGQKLWMKSLFATHPNIDDRIARLRKM